MEELNKGFMTEYVGQRLGNYRIIRRVGRGGFANVYLGEHVYLKTLAAIKVLQIQLANETLKKFLMEARTIARLDHPHIVRVLDFGIENMTPFLVMSYAANGTLRQRHPFGEIVPISTIISYIKSVTDALQYAHDRKIIHRDVKPENILLGQDQSVMLSDFGLAMVSHSVHSTPTQEAQHLKGTAGTTTYMAPEQFQGMPCYASDQYALGVVIYEWLCGAPPFRGAEMEIAVLHMHAQPPSLREMVPTLAPEVEQVVMRALAKDPDQRFASVTDFALALTAACPDHKPVPALAPPPLEFVVPSLPSQDSKRISNLNYSVGENSIHSLPLSFTQSMLPPSNDQNPSLASFFPQQRITNKAFPSAPTEPTGHQNQRPGRSYILHPMKLFSGRKQTALWLAFAVACFLGLIAISTLPLFMTPSPHIVVVPIVTTQSAVSATETVPPEMVTPTAVATAPTDQVVAAAPPVMSNPALLAIEPSQFSRTNCVTDNRNYRCTAMLLLSRLFKGNFTWNASTTGVDAHFSPANGTIIPGQTNQVIIYVNNNCAIGGSFVFTGNGAGASAPWHC